MKIIDNVLTDVSNKDIVEGCVIIPDSVTSIGEYAFYHCRSLTSITIPDSVTSIGDYAFWDCSNLSSVTIGNGVTSIVEKAFYNTAFYNNSSNWTDGVLYIGKYLIRANNDAISKDYAVKDGTVCIADYAFSGCSNLTSIIIPDSVTSIGAYAFKYCSSLTNITIPDSVTSIGVGAFWDYSNLKKLGKFKATNGAMICKDFQYELGKWYKEPEAILCRKGFHFCENAFDLFNYYSGKIGKDVRFFEVETEYVSDERSCDSKRVCRRIKLVREIKSYAELLN